MRVVRSLALAAGAVAAVTLVPFGIAIGASPDEAPGCPDPPTLSTLSGELIETLGAFFVHETEVDPGPTWYLTDAEAPLDYDGDGAVETRWAEINGLVGTTVTLAVDEAGRGGDRDLYAINGLQWREADGCPPPWAGGPRHPGGSPPWADRPEHAGPPPWADPDD